MRKLIEFFWEMFKVSLFVIGGGYAIIAVADDVCAKKKWTKEGELVDALPVFQMIPGLIATHTAVYVGRKLSGIPGAFLGVLAVALPSIVIFTIVSCCYSAVPINSPILDSAFTGLRSALVGIIAATLIRGWKRSLPDMFSFSLMFVALAALFLGASVWAVILSAILASLLLVFASPREKSGVQVKSSLLPLLVFLKYGALCFGGGFVLLPMYCEDFVGCAAPFLQIAESEFADLMALTQMTPGPIGVNAATFFGFKLHGILGAIVASSCLLLPGSVLAYCAFASLDAFRESKIVRGVMRGARPASVALMLFALFVFSGTCLFSQEEGVNLIALAITVCSILLIMKKKVNMIILSILAAFVAVVAKAGDITIEEYPDADSVLLEEIERVRYNPDGTYESHEESRTKILTERARRQESVVTLHYSKRYGEAAIEFVGITGADGVERAVDVRSLSKESTDNSSMVANIYDPLDRVIKCTVPGLKIGDVLRVKTFRRALKPRCEGAWGDISVMEWTCPIIRSVYEVVAPADRPLRKISIRNELGNIVSSSKKLPGGEIVHTFVCTNSPRCFPEPDMPPLYTQVQRVAVSTAEDWRDISKWYWKLCENHLSKTNAAMAAFVESARVQSGSSRLDLMRRIFRFVSQEVRYMGLTMEETSPGYAPHDVDVTFDNRYGVCRDKAALLAALLRMAGFKAFPVLIHAGAKMDPDVPQPFFNHAIVAVEENPADEYILMDPTDESTVDMFPSYLGDKSYLVARPEGETLLTSPVATPEHNLLSVDSKCTVASDGSMFLDAVVSCKGINDIAYRHALIKRTKKERIKLITRILKSISPGAEVLECVFLSDDMSDTEKPLEFSIKARLPEAALRGKTGTELSVPFIGAKLGLANFLFRDNTSLLERKYPLVLDSTAGVKEKIKITLDDGAGKYLNPEGQLKSSVEGKYSLVRTLSVTGDVMIAERDVRISAVEFSPNEYAALRKALEESERIGKRMPFFANDDEADADERNISVSRETHIISDKAWVTTNKVVKKILTYAGKKDNSELSFSFNPAVCSIDIVEAWVSNGESRVVHVSEREKNVMDAGWVAAAPRYPASKTLIVNLPSVEIGSVVSWTVVRSVTNSPSPFRAEYYFDSYEPTDRIEVKVDDWGREEISPVRHQDENFQPNGLLWRDVVAVSKGGFDSVRERLRKIADVEALSPKAIFGEKVTSLSIKDVRDWMSKNVKIAGPGMWELPLESAITSPNEVLRERYATRLDYIRTLAALLRGAGFDADIVFSAGNATEEKEIRRKQKAADGNVRAFALPLCRVSDGEKTIFIGTESHYAPIGPAEFAHSDFYDPSKGEFGIVSVAEERFVDALKEKTVFDVKEDGSVEISSEQEIFGVGVEGFRKRYKEMLPEAFKRHYQGLVCSYSQAAVAKSDLKCDTDGYPAKRSFVCGAKDFAVVSGDFLKIELPPLPCNIPQLEDAQRKTSICVPADDFSRHEIVVKFPKGYTQVESVPEGFEFSFGGSSSSNVWITQKVSSREVDGRLCLSILRTLNARECEVFPASSAGLFRGWKEVSSSRASRTLIVRKKSGGGK